MSLAQSLKRLILPDTSLHCPRCEKSLTGHDEAACARRMSRRYFFGVAAGLATAVAVAHKLPTSGLFGHIEDPWTAYLENGHIFYKAPTARMIGPRSIYQITEAGVFVMDGRNIRNVSWAVPDPKIKSMLLVGDTIEFR